MDVKAQINASDLFSAKGLVLVITGGGTGLGLTIASAAVQTGAKRVYILGRRVEVLRKAAKDLDSTGNIVIPAEADVSDSISVEAVVSKIKQEIGFVDVLVNNAGVSGPNHKPVYDAQSIEEVSQALLSQSDKWESTMAINTTAVAIVSAAFLPLLDAANQRRGFVSGKVEAGNKLTAGSASKKGGARERKSADVDGVDSGDMRTSQIITVSSIAAFNRYVTAGLAYASSKAGAVAIGKSLATMLSPWGIRSNVICPGLFPSEMTAGGILNQYPWDEIPAHRAGAFGEFAGTVLYMVGKSGAYLNGSVQIVDGGRLSVMHASY